MVPFPIPLFAVQLIIFVTAILTLFLVHFSQAAGAHQQSKWLFYPLGFVICWAGAPTVKKATGGFVKNRHTFSVGGLVVYLLNEFAAWAHHWAPSANGDYINGTNSTEADCALPVDGKLLPAIRIVSILQAIGFYILLNQYQPMREFESSTTRGKVCTAVVAVASLIELVLLLRLNEPDWHNQSQLILLLGFEVRVLFFIGEYFCSGVNMAKDDCHATFPALFFSCSFASFLSALNCCGTTLTMSSILMACFLLQTFLSLPVLLTIIDIKLVKK